LRETKNSFIRLLLIKESVLEKVDENMNCNFPIARVMNNNNVSVPKFDKHIPIPDSHAGGFTATIMEMSVGDSFFTTKGRENFSSMITLCQKKSGRRFTTRSRRENGEAGYRIWRTA